MSENKRAEKYLADAAKYIGEENAQAMLTAIQAVETQYIATAGGALERALDESRTILNEPPVEGYSQKDHDNAVRAIGNYFLESITCDNLGSAATVSLLRQESIAVFVAHACQHHEDAKMEQMRHMLRDAFAPVMERSICRAAEANGIDN